MKNRIIKTLVYAINFTLYLLMLTSCTNRQIDNTTDNTSIESLRENFEMSGNKKQDDINADTTEIEGDSDGKDASYLSEFHPIVIGDVLIGGNDENQWLAANKIVQELSGNEIYKLYDLSGYIGDATGTKAQPYTNDWIGAYTEFVELKHDFGDDLFIATSSEWDVMPRLPILQSGNNDFYKEVINDLLETYGLYGGDIEILQNYKIDFEGDGVDEVVLYAENRKTNNSDWVFDEAKGCFSILVLRKIVDGDVKNYVLNYDVHLEDTDADGLNRRIRYIFPIVGFADLNGDGKMELITACKYYEGTSYQVFEVNDIEIETVLTNGYGA